MDMSLLDPYAVVQIPNLLRHLVQQTQPRRRNTSRASSGGQIQVRRGRNRHDKH